MVGVSRIRCRHDRPVAVDTTAVLGRSGTLTFQEHRPTGRDTTVDGLFDLDGEPPVVAVVVLVVQPLADLGEQLVDANVPRRRCRVVLPRLAQIRRARERRVRIALGAGREAVQVVVLPAEHDL